MDKSEKLWSRIYEVHKQIGELKESIHELLEKIADLEKQEEELKNEYAAAVMQVTAKE